MADEKKKKMTQVKVGNKVYFGSDSVGGKAMVALVE